MEGRIDARTSMHLSLRLTHGFKTQVALTYSCEPSSGAMAVSKVSKGDAILVKLTLVECLVERTRGVNHSSTTLSFPLKARAPYLLFRQEELSPVLDLVSTGAVSSSLFCFFHARLCQHESVFHRDGHLRKNKRALPRMYFKMSSTESSPHASRS